jgi:hypothetical protein
MAREFHAMSMPQEQVVAVAKGCAMTAEWDALRAALEDCITEPGAMAERSHEFALRRLAAITGQADAALSRSALARYRAHRAK